MNGDFKEWSKEVLSLIEESNKSNKEEHSQIIKVLDDFSIRMTGRFKKFYIALFVLSLVGIGIITWELVFHLLVR
jgi:hypothetical protein